MSPWVVAQSFIDSSLSVDGLWYSIRDEVFYQQMDSGPDWYYSETRGPKLEQARQELRDPDRLKARYQQLKGTALAAVALRVAMGSSSWELQEDLNELELRMSTPIPKSLRQASLDQSELMRRMWDSQGQGACSIIFNDERNRIEQALQLAAQGTV
ncbi:MAG: hypothetical protein CO132_04315 [Candidatus Kerfeldbacteria bacterium CG_4_9_14_3_um_filter_45_8]|nr:MAG: hypothetical protein CO132_04315 [Candidatus Kerfeldbacteria bacterium CG_4_9_14_3_um_filter_45_8]